MGMELKDFVTKALLEIVEGIAAAQAAMPDGQMIGTTRQEYFRDNSRPANIVQDAHANVYSVVSFDVAVTTVDEVKGEGGIKVFSIGAKGEATGRAETASRIQFATTVRLA
jgi:hypothetical protein